MEWPRMALLGMAWAVLGGCDALVAPCGPANCLGCCDERGVCLEGKSSAACGVGGAMCAPCTGSCLEGVCRGPSDSDAGCRPDCVGKACGPDGCGGVCGTCTAPAFATPRCDAGQCGFDCLAGYERCRDGGACCPSLQTCRQFDNDQGGCISAGCSPISCPPWLVCWPVGTPESVACPARCLQASTCGSAPRCTYFACAGRCWPAGTPTAAACPSTASECRLYDNDLEVCNAKGCAYDACSNQCWPTGTPLPTACPHDCRRHSTLGDCNAAGCAWYACAEQCWPRGTPISTVCARECRAADGDAGACAALPGCSDFACSSQCWPTGTPNAVACP